MSVFVPVPVPGSTALGHLPLGLGWAFGPGCAWAWVDTVCVLSGFILPVDSHNDQVVVRVGRPTREWPYQTLTGRLFILVEKLPSQATLNSPWEFRRVVAIYTLS